MSAKALEVSGAPRILCESVGHEYSASVKYAYSHDAYSDRVLTYTDRIHIQMEYIPKQGIQMATYSLSVPG